MALEFANSPYISFAGDTDVRVGPTDNPTTVGFRWMTYAVGDWDAICSKWSNPGQEFRCGINNSATPTFRVEGRDGASNYQTCAGGPTIIAGRWYHGAFSYWYDGANTQVRLYLDGKQVGSHAFAGSALQSDSTPLRIGSAVDTSNHWNGQIEQFTMWKGYVLSPSEIAALHEGANPLTIARSSLKIYAPLVDPRAPAELIEGRVMTVTGSLKPTPSVYDKPIRGISFGAGEVLGPESQEDQDSATIYLDIQPSSADIFASTQAATVYLDIQPSTTFEQHTTFDAATVLLDLTVLGGECYSRFHFTGEGDAETRWTTVYDQTRWASDEETRWVLTIEVQPGC